MPTWRLAVPDLSLLWALVLGVVGCLVYAKTRRRPPKEIRCPECKVPLEHDADILREMLEPDITPSPLMRPGQQPQAALYHCPQCGRRTRVDF
jgi:hypothetical protein